MPSAGVMHTGWLPNSEDSLTSLTRSPSVSFTKVSSPFISSAFSSACFFSSSVCKPRSSVETLQKGFSI